MRLLRVTLTFFTLFTLSLSALLSASSAQQVNPEGYPIVDEPVTLTLMGARSPIQGNWQDMKLFQYLADLTNIRFTFDTPPQDGYTERKNLIFASGQLPDLFFGGQLEASDEVIYGAQGLLIPLEDLIAEHAPNVQQFLDENPDIRAAITAPDGHIYSLPKINTGFSLYPKLWINQPWLEALDLDMPTTLDEFYDVLVAFRDGDPNGNGQQDEIPLTAHSLGETTLGDIRPALLAAHGFSVGYTGTTIVDVQDGAVVFVPIEDGYRDYLTYLNRLYSEGLLDPESFAQSRQQITAKGEADRLGVFNHAGPFLVVGSERNSDYPHIQPLTSELSPEPIWPEFPPINRGTFAITSRNPQPEATMRWVDWFYGEEGGLISGNGIEGEDWEYTEEGGIRRLVPEGVNPEEARARATPDVGSIIPRDNRLSYELNTRSAERDNPNNAFIDRETNEKLVPVARAVFPPIYFTEDEQRQLNLILTDLELFVEQAEAQFVTGQRSLDTWDEYVATLERIGIQQVIDIYQAAYDRFLAAE